MVELVWERNCRGGELVAALELPKDEAMDVARAQQPRLRGVHTDVAIVGAGPAGARAAYVLARHGARVTLFDRSHPREKPCGGGVTGRALALVADTFDAADCAASVIRSARFIDSRRGQSAFVLLDTSNVRNSSEGPFTARCNGFQFWQFWQSRPLA